MKQTIALQNHSNRSNRVNLTTESRHGFTMIEILVVVAVIVSLLGLIAGVAQFANDRAARAQCQGDLAKIESYLATMLEQEGSYPPGGGTLEQFRTTGNQNSLQHIHEANGNRAELQDFILRDSGGNKVQYKDLPFRDPWGMDYIYIYPAPKNPADQNSATTKKRFLLGSRGPNRKLGKDNTLAQYGQFDDITTEN